jgi:hypothetical protein
MESVLLYAIIISCSVSTLFVLTRAYFAYFAKGKCNGNSKCGCNDTPVGEASTVVSLSDTKLKKGKQKELPATAKITPKRPSKPKAKASTTKPGTTKLKL